MATAKEPDSSHGTSADDPHASIQQRLRRMTDECVDEEEIQRTLKQRCRSMSEESLENIAEDIAQLHGGQLTFKGKVLNGFRMVSDLVSFFIYGISLCFRMVKWFKFWWWTVQLAFRTIIWTTMLLPSLLPYAAAYFLDRRICRRIRFGGDPREYLDIYIPQEAILALKGSGKKVPVVVAVMGGGFLIGHRSYNAQLGLRFLDFGVMFVCIDYRNFPFAQIPDMVENVSRGIRWVFQNIESFGGDVSNMILTGQSAGAHLSATALVEHCLLEAKHNNERMKSSGGSKNDEDFDCWSVHQFKAYFGVSGPYDIEGMAPFIGLPPRAVRWLTMNNPNSCSPGFLVSSDEWMSVADLAATLLPPIHLFHGEGDTLVPSYASVDFAKQLRGAGIDVKLDVRSGLNHTYAVIEGPAIRHDIQLELMLPVLFGEGAESKLSIGKSRAPMVPRSVVKLAALISPFGKVSRPYIDSTLWYALLPAALLGLLISICLRFII